MICIILTSFTLITYKRITSYSYSCPCSQSIYSLSSIIRSVNSSITAIVVVIGWFQSLEKLERVLTIPKYSSFQILADRYQFLLIYIEFRYRSVGTLLPSHPISDIPRDLLLKQHVSQLNYVFIVSLSFSRGLLHNFLQGLPLLHHSRILRIFGGGMICDYEFVEGSQKRLNFLATELAHCLPAHYMNIIN